MNRQTWLDDRRENVHSQTGEDGVITAALERLTQRNGWCVDFGAADGVTLSNSRLLVERYGYHAVQIEADPTQHAALCANALPTVHPIHAAVGWSGPNRLDALLAAVPNLPRDFDFLSVDIDGNDVHVWRALKDYLPSLVLIEFNPTMATAVDWEQARDVAVMEGASLAALVRCGREMGYSLICALPWNALFSTDEQFPQFDIADNRQEVLRHDTGLVTRLWWDYAGRVHLVGACRSPWHPGLALTDADVQVLPPELQAYPRTYTDDQVRAYAALIAKRNGQPGLDTGTPPEAE